MKKPKPPGVLVESLEAICAPSTATMKGLLNKNHFLGAQQTPRPDAQQTPRPKTGRIMSRQDQVRRGCVLTCACVFMHLSVFISFLLLFLSFLFCSQLLQDHRLSIKSKLDLQARLEEAKLGSLLFWHGEEAQPQYTARHGNLSTRPQSVRSGAATCRWNGPDRPGQSMHEKSVARPLTAREREKTTFDDGRQRRPATARPAAQSDLRRPSGAHDVGWDAATNVSNNGSESSSQTPVLRLWAMFTAE